MTGVLLTPETRGSVTEPFEDSDSSEFPYVVDSSVGVKWVVEEENTQFARLLLSGTNRLLVPGHFYSEVMNVLWKRTRYKEPEERITIQDARDGLTRILKVPLELVPNKLFALEALDIALGIGKPSYDCEYLALALREHAVFVTADERFYHEIRLHPHYSLHVKWIGEL